MTDVVAGAPVGWAGTSYGRRAEPDLALAGATGGGLPHR
jgi:hypothetical protein